MFYSKHKRPFLGTGINVCLLLIALVSYGFSESSKKEYYASGMLMSELVYDSSCNCEYFHEYYESGEILQTTRYLHPKEIQTIVSGPTTRYFRNGQVMHYTYFKNGVPDGREYSNFPDGTLGYEKYYRDGYKDSTWRFYNENYTIRLVQHYKPGKAIWNSELDFVTNKFFLAGKLAYTETISNGKRTKLIVADRLAYDSLVSLQPKTGQQLFLANCAMCHSMNRDIVGPALQGVTTRRSNIWLREMILLVIT